MLHDLCASGTVFGLRPVGHEDAEFIVALRAQSQRTQYIHRGATTVDAQRAWTDAYLARTGDYYFMVHRLADGRREGTISIYDLDADRRTAEWGRWVLAPDSLASIESVMLMYRVAFNVLHLSSVYSRTLAKNESVVSFHDSCGVPRSPTMRTLAVDGVACAAIEHRLARVEWPELERRLEPMIRRIARRSRTNP
jgi:RimJ/RimL family protein N-acetyltransferase